jgi:Flp pilus assembly protein TadD
VAAIAAATVAGTVFWLFRTQTHFYGDGYQLLSYLSDDGLTGKAWDRATNAVVTFFHSMFERRFADPALAAYRAFSISAGIAYATAVVILVPRIVSGRKQQWLLIGGAFSAGYLILFFGYVENYAWLTAAVAVTGLAGTAVERGRLSRWWLVPAALVASASHIVGLAVIPAVLFVLLKGTRLHDKISRVSWRAWAWIVAADIVLGIAVLKLIGDNWLFARFAVLPVIADRFTVSNYTLWSGPHLIDMLNLILLITPGTLVILMGLLSSRRVEEDGGGAAVFWGLLVIPTLTLSFVIDPKLGMPRDWDLLAFGLAPLHLWLFWMLARRLARSPGLLTAGLLAIVLGGLAVSARLSSANSDTAAVERYEYYLRLDQAKARNAHAALFRYYVAQGDTAKAQKVDQRYSSMYPEKQIADSAAVLLRSGRFEDARQWFMKALEVNPVYGDAYTGVGYACNYLGRYDSAAAYLTIAEALNPYNPAVQNALGLAYVNTGHFEEAECHLHLAARLDPTLHLPWANLAYISAARGEADKAEEYFNKLAQNPGTPAETYTFLAGQFMKAGWETLAAESNNRAVESAQSAKTRPEGPSNLR